MRICEINFIENGVERKEIIDLVGLKYEKVEDENQLFAVSSVKFIEDGKTLLTDYSSNLFHFRHRKIYTGNFTVYDIVADILNSRYQNNSFEEINIKYFNINTFFNSEMDWRG